MIGSLVLLVALDAAAANLHSGWSAEQAELDVAFSNMAQPTPDGWVRGEDTRATLARTRACVECSFVGTSLRGQDLHGVDLSRASLMMTDLRGANLRGAKLAE